MRYWLMKSEPEEFSIDDLKHRPKQTEPWDGVRNYQARNFMRDEMRNGDQAFFYHSSCKTPGIAGIMEIVREGYPDHTAFDPESKHFDPKSDPEKPRWFMVDVKYARHTGRVISLAELKEHDELAGMKLLQKGNRLSVMPVSEHEWFYILGLENHS
ncbi:MAG: EVE domain-containing protein [Desulfuromonadaceae bacterium]